MLTKQSQGNFYTYRNVPYISRADAGLLYGEVRNFGITNKLNTCQIFTQLLTCADFVHHLL